MDLIRLHYLKDNKISILWGDDSEIKSIVEDGMDSVASPSNLKLKLGKTNTPYPLINQ